MNYTIATVSLERFAEIIKATTYHAIPATHAQDSPKSCVHLQVLGQSMTIYGTDGISASWGSLLVEAGDTPSLSLNSKRMLQAVKDLRMAAKPDKQAALELAIIDNHLRMEAAGLQLHVEIYPEWKHWRWTTQQPNNDVIASCTIEPKELAKTLKPHKDNRLCMTITRRDNVAPSWIDLQEPTVISDAMTLKRSMMLSTIHTIGVNNVEDWNVGETRQVWFYAQRFAKTLAHVGKMPQLRIYRTWLSKQYGLLSVSDDVATHVVMPAKPPLEREV